MTTEMVKDAWGEPDRVNSMVVNSVVKGGDDISKHLALMEQGKLKEWGPVTR
jgi:hypothetical protein